MCSIFHDFTGLCDICMNLLSLFLGEQVGELIDIFRERERERECYSYIPIIIFHILPLWAPKIQSSALSARRKIDDPFLLHDNGYFIFNLWSDLHLLASLWSFRASWYQSHVHMFISLHQKTVLEEGKVMMISESVSTNLSALGMLKSLDGNPFRLDLEMDEGFPKVLRFSEGLVAFMR